MQKVLTTLFKVLMACLIICSGANADPTHDNVPTHLNGAKLQGQGRMTYWGFDLYDAQLFVTGNGNQASYALKINYLRNFKADALREQTLKEMRQLGVSDENRQKWSVSLEKIFPNIAPGHSLTAIYRPQRGTLFLHNGQVVGEVPGDDFSKSFFGIWLDPRTSAPQLRTQLLSQGCTPSFINQQC
jgi:hypothetical protein